MRDDRREFLKAGLGFGLGAGMIGALPGLTTTAAASGAGGYRALVCVHLDGGIDCHDVLIPTGVGDYADWAKARGTLLDNYEMEGDDSRVRDNLIGIDNAGKPSGVGLPRQLSPLAGLYRAGHLSIVANTGVLEEPMSRSDVMAGRLAPPARFGSHNDSASMWMSCFPEGASSGWGGRLTDRLSAGANTLSGIVVNGNSAFPASDHRSAYAVGMRGVTKAWGTYSWPFGSNEAPKILEAHYKASASGLNSLLATDFQNAQRQAVGTADTLAGVMSTTDAGDSIVIEGNDLSKQLAVVAKLISLNAKLGIDRQTFYVRQTGYDDHANQAKNMPMRQTRLAEALAAFYQETVRLGVANNVLTFTASEFGRTLVPNKTGTDHGWGGHAFVMGGGIAGGRIIGELPPTGLGHEQDLDRGRLIPTTALDQYIGGLGKWYGASEEDLYAVLPTYGRTGPALAL